MNIDPEKLVVLFVIAMLVLGPNRLPQAAKTAARWLAEIRRYTSGIRNEMRQLLDEDLQHGTSVRDEIRSAIAEPREAIEAGAREVRSWPAEALASPSEKAIAVPDDPNLN